MITKKQSAELWHLISEWHENHRHYKDADGDVVDRDYFKPTVDSFRELNMFITEITEK